MWNPTEADLTTYMHAQAEAAYQQRARPKCSREDFLDGYAAALRDLRSRSSFRPDRFESFESVEQAEPS
jgi:hypothetical protein